METKIYDLRKVQFQEGIIKNIYSEQKALTL